MIARTLVILVATTLLPAVAGGASDELNVAERRALFEEAAGLNDEGHHDEAIEVYARLLEAEPEDSSVHHEIGHAHYLAGDYDGCVESTRRALEIESEVDSHALLGHCLDASGNPRQALLAYRAGLEEHPAEARITYNMAATLFRLQRFEEAVSTLEATLATEPTHTSSNHLLASTYVQNDERIPAVLALLRFSSLEQGTERAADAARQLTEVLGRGIRHDRESYDGGTEVAIRVEDPRAIPEGSPLRYLADGSVEILLEADDESPTHFRTDSRAVEALADVVHLDPEMTEIEHYVAQVSVLTHYLPTLATTGASEKFAVAHFRPFFIELLKGEHLAPLVRLALEPLDLPGGSTWLDSNRSVVDALRVHLTERDGEATGP